MKLGRLAGRLMFDDNATDRKVLATGYDWLAHDYRAVLAIVTVIIS